MWQYVIYPPMFFLIGYPFQVIFFFYWKPFSFFYLSKSFIAGKPGFSKKQADLFFPPDFQDDFPVAMQVYIF